MLSTYKNKALVIYNTIVSSIAFYPTLISVSLLFLSFLLLSLEDADLTKFLLDNAPFLVINDSDTARSILSTLIGGLISLTVFSFSMVMVLLNQASSNFSPRLLPGLISDRRNQIVLGFYLGTIVYNIIVLISILPTGDAYTMNGFSILVGIVLGLISLALFVFFIHTISEGIQINFILKKIFNKSKKRLEFLIDEERDVFESFDEETEDWDSIKSNKAGYYYGFRSKGLSALGEEFKTDFKIVTYEGIYLLPNMVVIRSKKTLNKDQKEKVKQLILYTGNQDAEDNYILGIKQITEVGIKAMSPGINDPGTAIMTIDYLTELLALRMKIGENKTPGYVGKNCKIEYTSLSFEPLIYNCLAAYRQYCKHDILLIEKLILMLKYLLKQPCKHDYYAMILKRQLETIEEDFEEYITNKSDRQKLIKLIGSL